MGQGCPAFRILMGSISINNEGIESRLDSLDSNIFHDEALK
jgi:hypothetical protein